jgi:hypothetical protein
MKWSNMFGWLPALALVFCTPGFSATVYKTVDENGAVSFSDTLPSGQEHVETMVIDSPAMESGEVAQPRLEDMRETTDRMVADRMAREKHRAQMRQLQAQTDAQQMQGQQAYVEQSPIYSGYYQYPIRRPWRAIHGHRPAHPIARPPLRPHRGNNGATIVIGGQHTSTRTRTSTSTRGGFSTGMRR